MSAPRAWARGAVRLATAVLPTPEARRRYRSEFLAELTGLSPADQTRLVGGVLFTAFALRAALARSAHYVGEGVLVTHSSWRRFRCHVLRMHYWKAFSNPDGERYVACTVCATERVGRVHPFAPAGAGLAGM
jgi:hypothetical protein